MRKLFLIIFLVSHPASVFAATPTPYGGTPWAIPGTIQFEDYDSGGEGVAFHDTTPTNTGSQYRVNDAVDIRVTDDGSGSTYDLTAAVPGEWFKYTVNVLTTGIYTLTYRIQEWGDAWGGKAHLEIDGVNVTSTISFFSGVWNGWNTYTIPNLSLTAGQHVLRWYLESASMPSAGNFNWMHFEYNSQSNPTPPVVIPTPGSQIFYVAPNGNDDANPGTVNAPWKTIAKAANTLTAGQTVYIRTGTYPERLIPAHSGTENAYIIFANFPGETVTLDGAGIDYRQSEGIVAIKNRSYIRVTGLKIINGGVNVPNGFWHLGISNQYSDHIVIDHNYVSHIYSIGISVSSFTNYSLIDSNELVDTNFGTNYPNPNNDTEVSLGIYWYSNHIEVRNNIIHDVHNEGYDPVAGASYISIHDNIAYNCGRQGFYVDSWTEKEHDIEFYNNISYRNGTNNGMGGFLVSSEAGGTLENVKFYNNIAYGNVGEGFYITSIGIDTTGSINNIAFVNNTLYHNGRAGILIENPIVTNILLRNNLVYQNYAGIQIASSIPTGAITQDHNLTSDPQFVSITSNNFHLQASSPAIDSGATDGTPTLDFDLKPRPIGAGFDLGAFEYGNISPPKPFDYTNYLSFLPTFNLSTSIFDFNQLITLLFK